MIKNFNQDYIEKSDLFEIFSKKVKIIRLQK
jgi:hypothetical protein